MKITLEPIKLEKIKIPIILRLPVGEKIPNKKLLIKEFKQGMIESAKFMDFGKQLISSAVHIEDLVPTIVVPIRRKFTRN